MFNPTEYREDLNQVGASETFLAQTARRMLEKRLPVRRNPAWAKWMIGSAVAAAFGAVVLLCLPQQQVASPEMELLSSETAIASEKASSPLESSADIAELPGSSEVFHPWEDVYLAALVQIDPALIDYVGQDAYDAWAKRVSDEKTVYTDNGDESATASYDVSVLNEDGSVRYDFLDQSVAAFLEEFDIPRETFTALVPMMKSGTEEYYALRSQYGCAYTDQQVNALYSGQREQLLQAFAGTYTLYWNGELYPIYWFERHVAEEYRAVGFTAEQLAEVFTKWGMAIPENSNPDASFMDEYHPEAVIEQYGRLLVLEAE